MTSNRSLLFRVTNNGNGGEGFALAIDSNLGGDDFDPVPAVPAIYFDTDASGDFNAGDVAYTPGSNDPQLLADGFVDILLVNDIPLAVNNGEIGLSELIATSQTGNGAAGAVFAGQGEGGGDAVIGTSGGQAAANGEYLVSDVAVSIVKSVIVADPFGGTQPVPGATLTYTVDVQVTNTGTAVNSTVNDPIPVNTTYVPNSINLNARARDRRDRRRRRRTQPRWHAVRRRASRGPHPGVRNSNRNFPGNDRLTFFGAITGEQKL